VDRCRDALEAGRFDHLPVARAAIESGLAGTNSLEFVECADVVYGQYVVACFERLAARPRRGVRWTERFLATGRYQAVSVGMTRGEVEAALGPPASASADGSHWCYGYNDLLRFEDDELWLIEPWVPNLRRDALAGLGFELGSGDRVTLPSGVRLDFTASGRLLHATRRAFPPVVLVDLLAFCRTGRLGPLELGMTSACVEATLGPPDDVHENTTWGYGDIEVYLDEDVVWMLFSDTLDQRTPSRALDVLPWVLNGRLTLTDGRDALAREGLEFHEFIDARGPDARMLRLASGVVLQFDREDEGQPFLFGAFSHHSRSEPP
jgi:hypothetical protein